MKQSEAITYLDELLRVAQKARSNMLEALGDVASRAGIRKEGDWKKSVMGMYAEMEPWLFGEADHNGMLPSLVKLLERLVQGQPLDPQTFYNFMFIAHKSLNIQVVQTLRNEPEFPEPDINWFRGWEAE